MKEQSSVKIDTVENIRLVNVQTKKKKHIGQLIMHDGHTLYEWNRVLMQLDKATISEDSSAYIRYQGNKSDGKTFKAENASNKVIIKENCYYFTALNEKNAMRKIQAKFNPEFIIVLD